MSASWAWLVDKSTTALSSARLLLDADDPNGSCDRAFYAMYHSARAALAAEGQEPPSMKSEGIVIGAFDLRFVTTGRIPGEIGESLNAACEIKNDADHGLFQIAIEDARVTLQRAEAFVATVNDLLQSIEKVAGDRD